MNSILQAVVDQGVDLEDACLVGKMRHLFAGSREHWTGDFLVDVFKPVATHIVVEQTSSGKPLLTLTCEGESLENEEVFWSGLVASVKVDVKDAVTLAGGLVEHHRALTGEIGRTYEIIEKDPDEIARIKGHREDLKIGLMHLVGYMEKDAAVFDTIVFSYADGQENAYQKLIYERDILLATFRKDPCERSLYDDLRKSYSEGGHVGLGFDNYYTWFRKSESLFDAKDGIPTEKRDSIFRAMGAWMAAEENPSPEWFENKEKLFFRNFEVHPLHHHIVGACLKDAFQKLAQTHSSSSKLSPP